MAYLYKMNNTSQFELLFMELSWSEDQFKANKPFDWKFTGAYVKQLMK